MPRIRCHYLDCILLDDGLCSAAAVEVDPDDGCKSYTSDVLAEKQQEADLLDDDELDEDELDELDDGDDDWYDLDGDDDLYD